MIPMKNEAVLHLGEKIKQIRISKQISQKSMAQALGISKPYASYIESGHRNFDIKLLETIRKFLSIENAPLLGHELEVFATRMDVWNDLINADRIAEARKMQHSLSPILDLPYEHELRFLYTMNEVRLLFKDNNTIAAEKKIKEAEEYIDKVGMKAKCMYHMNKGFLYQNQDSNKAKNHFLKALDLAGKPEARLLANLGVAYFNLGKCHQAILYFERALARYHGDRTNLLGPTIKGQLATCYTHIGEYTKARKLFDKILPHLKSVDNGTVFGQQLYNRGILSMHMKDYNEAIEYFDQALALTHTKGAMLLYAEILINKARALMKLKRLSECQEIIDIARPLANENEQLTVMLTAISHQMNLNNRGATGYLENVAIPFLRANGGICKYIAINILKDLESHYLKKRSKQKAMAASHIIRELYEEFFLSAG